MIDPTDPEYDKIRADLVDAVEAVRHADEIAHAARRRRDLVLQRAREFGLTHGDIGHIIDRPRQQVHSWDIAARRLHADQERRKLDRSEDTGR